ncbi:MAG: hypothetical protein ACLU8F_04190 [Clostridia bacterium]
MKKILVSVCMLLTVLAAFCIPTVVQATSTAESILNDKATSTIIEIKEKSKKELKDFEDSYGSKTYGLVAYILDKVRIYSIPFCFIGIVIGAVYKYVLGIRKLDVQDRGLFLLVGFVTVLVICQVLPLVFAIIVKGWRG